jgi:hypothetical protein
MTPLERAFELAASGRFMTIEQLITALSREGYETRQVYGKTLKKQLSNLMSAARMKSNVGSSSEQDRGPS